MAPKLLMITGASGGIARALLQLCDPAQHQVAAVSRNQERLQHVLTGLDSNLEIIPVVGDVSNPEGAEAVFETIADRTGGRVPDQLAHCVGTTLLAPLHRTTDSQYRDCMTANLDSAFFTLRAWIQRRLKQTETAGSAVLFTSVVAQIGVTNHEAIAAAKGALVSLVPAIAATYSGQGIRINGIAPGLTRTGATERLFSARGAEEQIAAQYPLGRYAQPEDQARAAAWLLSDAASWITGQILPVDGGFTAVRPMVRAR
jgi:NAD(P)-dependent dehydrogenase (short-subunit alcohol dehydrogenase family)